MNHSFKVFIVLLPILIFSQDVSKKNIFSRSPLINKEQKKSSSVLENNSFTFCDTDSDGFMPIDLNEFGDYVLNNYSSQLVDESGIYISTSSSALLLSTNLGSSPQIQKICTKTPVGFGMFDIAINQNGEMYSSEGNHIYKINALTCQIENTFTFGQQQFINSLSFDRNFNIYLGGFDSSVYRLEKDYFNTLILWKNFGSGAAAGDFVMLGNKMYIAWDNDGACLLYEVTVDANTNYVSHIVLGNLPYGTFGLASELGNLYGVTERELYKINIDSNPLKFESILLNSFLEGAWYGATGRNEAVAFEVKVFETEINAQNNVNPLPSMWVNTVSGGQTVYVSILNTNNLKRVIVPIDLKVNVAPSYTNPIQLEHCDDRGNVFDLRKTEPGIIGLQSNIVVTYHETEIDAINNTNYLPDMYTLKTNDKRIYVRTTNSITNCYSVFYFGLKILPKPIYNRPDDLIVCKSGKSNYFLIDLEKQIPLILGNQNSNSNWVAFYNSQDDALNKVNALQLLHNFEEGKNEVFVRIDNNSISECPTLGSFNVNVIAENNNFQLNYNLQISDWSYQENSIEIIDNGNYEYSLTGLDYQDIPVFYNLTAGEHKIYVRDKDNCSISIDNAFLLMYPKYFTPNGDGINDYWNIIASYGEPNLEIIIYDRYGKIVKIIKGGNDIGWDGKSNNVPLPASDYWFVALRASGEKMKGHFSLKR